MILFVDLGSYYAIAGSPLPGCSLPTVVSKDTSSKSHGERFQVFYDDLTRTIELYEHKTAQDGLQGIFYEKVYRHMGNDAAHLYGAFYGVLAMVSHLYMIPLEGIGVQAIKKHATGKGNATKAQMIDAAIDAGWQSLIETGRKRYNDNVADALFGLSLCQGKVKP